MSTSTGPEAAPGRLKLLVGAVGVVYGDIGTSPLYALDKALHAATGGAIDRPAVLGVLSLIFWSVLIVVTLKYVVLILRADNDGEGGVLSLFALVQKCKIGNDRWRRKLIGLAVLGAALYYCDALITPAMSVMSAVEGLTLLDPAAGNSVVPVTLVILVVLFLVQSRGADRVGAMFGPVMLLWFSTLAVLGVLAIRNDPGVLVAVSPTYAIQMMFAHPGVALAVVGAAFLALTGSEALYADMGHFGRKPVRIAWFGIVWPSLILNYFGQGAHLLAHPEDLNQPLYALAPDGTLPALVVLATLATVIASQAVITSAFSITRQAIQLDFLPRMRVLQTSAHSAGQIYVPAINWLLAVAVAFFVVGFKSSDALAGAYGVAVAGTMLITTLFALVLASTQWRWSKGLRLAVFGPLVLIDLTFVVGNLGKLAEGAWVPVLLAGILFGLFSTWRIGREKLRRKLQAQAQPITRLPTILQGVTRVPGTAVFLASSADSVPSALLRNLEHNHVVHERVVILNVEIQRSPRWDAADRVLIEDLAPDIVILRARFGYMETPDVGEALRQARSRGLKLFADDSSFFVGWHIVTPRPRTGYEGLLLRLFAWMQRRSAQASEFFRMPERRTIALITQIEL
ncbi:MAG: KUP/HAK/KT family potassium transporter [Steroidobacteraceae bacterium]